MRAVRTTLLLVCTANICRSPAAANRFASALGTEVQVLSAGARAVAGAPGCPDSAALAGFDGGRHRATQLTAGLVDEAALVLTFDRGHRAAVLELSPAAQRRCFTLRQAARTCQWLAAEPLGRRPSGLTALEILALDLDAARGLVPRPERSEEDDVSDPHGWGAEAHAAAAAAVEQAAAPVVAHWRRWAEAVSRGDDGATIGRPRTGRHAAEEPARR